MSLEAYPQRASEPETYEHILTFTGAGSSNPTVNFGKGLTVARTSQGVYTITFVDFPGNLCGFGASFQATTISDLKGYTCVIGRFDATGKILIINITDSSQALQDLTSTRTISLSITFKRAQTTL